MMQVQIIGQKEIDGIFNALPYKIGKKVLLRAFRAAAKPLISAAREKIPTSKKKGFVTAYNDFTKGAFSTLLRYHLPGQLKRSIGTILGKAYKGFPSLWIGPRKGYKRKDDGWYGHFVEFGTEGFTVKKDITVMLPNGPVTLKKGTHIPGQSPHPYMRPAWDGTQNLCIKIINDTVAMELEKEINKL